MKMSDVKTLITSGSLIVAVALYLIFAPDNTEGPIEIGEQIVTPAEAVEITGNELQAVEFVSANDGDTFNVLLDGKKERVRLLMVDTPEMNYNKGEPMPYAEEAKEFTINLLENATNIEVLFDVGDERDNYDRLLAYVFVDDVLLQESLLKEGLAAVRYIHEPNNSLEEEFLEAQEVAASNNSNIWKTDDYFKNGRFDESFTNE